MVVTGGLAGCSDDDGPTAPGGPDPTTYATVGFVFDDTTDQIYGANAGLAWKGTFRHDPATGTIVPDPTWSGPFVMLHDDGAVADGGHEPAGATAGDHAWGAVARVATDIDLSFQYGVIQGSIDGSDGDWIDDNVLQTVTIAAGDTGLVVAPTLTVVAEDPPAEFAVVTFAIDDTADHLYDASDGLAWKGSFRYDPATRVLTFDGAWTGPFVMLHDDGPLSDRGHEPEDAIAGDHVWSVSVLVDNSESRQLEYGAIRGSVDGSDGPRIRRRYPGAFSVNSRA